MWVGVDLRSGVDVADIGGDTGCAGDIVKGELGDKRVEFHEQSEGLADPAGGTEDGDLALGDGVDGVSTTRDVPRYGRPYGSENGRPHCSHSERERIETEELRERVLGSGVAVQSLETMDQFYWRLRTACYVGKLFYS